MPSSLNSIMLQRILSMSYINLCNIRYFRCRPYVFQICHITLKKHMYLLVMIYGNINVMSTMRKILIAYYLHCSFFTPYLLEVIDKIASLWGKILHANNCIGNLTWRLDRLAIYLPSFALSVLLTMIAMLEM